MFFVVFLVACQPKKDTSPTTSPVPTSPPGPSTPDSKGTSDQGGGGNLINGKPLEFYKRDITQLPEYIKFVDPIDKKLNDIREDNQADNGVTYLATAAKRKTWYIVPVKIEELEAARIGTNFKSDQGAYQTEKEIFISELVYKDLDEQHKAQLLLHETVMAFYLVKYEDGRFYCEAFKKASVRENCLNSFTDLSSKTEFKPAQKNGKFLEPEEYESIRHVTEWLFNGYKTLTKLKFEEKMFEKKFDPRVFNNRNIVDRQQNQPTEMQTKDILKILETQRLTNQSLTHCGFDFSLKTPTAMRACKIVYTVKDKLLNMTIQTDDGKTESIDFAIYPTVFATKVGFKNGLTLFKVRFNEAARSDHGKSFRTLLFWMQHSTSTEFGVKAIRIQKSIWIKQDESGNSLRSEEVNQKPEEDIYRLIYGSKETDISIDDLY
ncbi:MAG: hypothetical protein JNL11_09555 [Bdellovibrionaceae bacterium]|nr:hypothetical protein [Pseudobdellovibrionaceae bacterium]